MKSYRRPIVRCSEYNQCLEHPRLLARNRLDLEEYAAQTAFGVVVVTSTIFTAFAGRLAQRMPRAAPEQALYVCVEIAWLLKHLAFLLRLVVRRLVQVSSLENFKV